MFLTGASDNRNDSFPFFLSLFSFCALRSALCKGGGGQQERTAVWGAGVSVILAMPEEALRGINGNFALELAERRGGGQLRCRGTPPVPGTALASLPRDVGFAPHVRGIGFG